MLSRLRIGVSQAGQCDPGNESDSPLGKRQITTFANDPNSNPKAVNIARNSASISIAP